MKLNSNLKKYSLVSFTGTRLRSVGRIQLLAMILLTGSIFFTTHPVTALGALAQIQPNIIAILTDDQGYADVGFNGCNDIPTPNIDRIASNGVIFTNGYDTYPVCRPSLAGLITERHQDRFGFGRNSLLAPNDPGQGLPLSGETMVTVLADPFEPDNTVPVVPHGYHLVWADEFNHNGAPDETFWAFENGFVRNEELQWYQPSNAQVKNGLLVIEGKRERVKNPSFERNSNNWKSSREFAEYTSASIKTKDKYDFKYGILEVRARIDTSMGSWPAIWTLGIERRWPENGEVDIMEYYRIGGIPTILANAAWKGENQWEPVWDSEKIPFSRFLERDPRWPEKFHVWKMVWTKESIGLYLDEELLNEIDLDKANYEDGFNPFHQPHYILLNLALGANGGDPSGSVFPLKYEVDYVRVYQPD